MCVAKTTSSKNINLLINNTDANSRISNSTNHHHQQHNQQQQNNNSN